MVSDMMGVADTLVRVSIEGYLSGCIVGTCGAIGENRA